jgi:phosphoheptose isomerase
MDVSWIAQRLDESSRLKSSLAFEQSGNINRAGHAIAAALSNGGKVLLFGNGGSAADAQHIAAEFVGRFAQDRAPLPALALTTDTAALTAIGNDYGFAHIFARQLQALGRPGDVAVAISTSGRSPNVLAGVTTAREQALTTIALTGGEGGLLAGLTDISIVVPSGSTARIQECHLTIGHILCEMVETLLFVEDSDRETSKRSPRLLKPPLVASTPKVMDWRTLIVRRERWRAQRKVAVWTNGCFDLLHLGHVRSLQAARSLGDVLIVGVNSDDSVRQLKGVGRPIVAASERAEILAALDCVDCVVIFDELTPELILSRVKPDVHCKGTEYAPPYGKPVPESSVVETYGGRIEFLPLLSSHSTSALIQCIRNQGSGKPTRRPMP